MYYSNQNHIYTACVRGPSGAALGGARLKEFAPTEAPVCREGARPGHTAGSISVFTLHGFLPTDSRSPGLLEVTPAAPSPRHDGRHDGQVDLIVGRGGGVDFSFQTPWLPSSL